VKARLNNDGCGFGVRKGTGRDEGDSSGMGKTDGNEEKRERDGTSWYAAETGTGWGCAKYFISGYYHSARINTARGMAQLKLNHTETAIHAHKSVRASDSCHACISDESCLRCCGLHREQCLWQPEEAGMLG